MKATVVPADSQAMRPSSTALAEWKSRWLVSAAQTIATARHAGTAALEAPSPPARGTNAATTAQTMHAPSSRIVTETEGRAVNSGDMSALRGVRTGRIPQTPLSVLTCGALTN